MKINPCADIESNSRSAQVESRNPRKGSNEFSGVSRKTSKSIDVKKTQDTQSLMIQIGKPKESKPKFPVKEV